MNVRRDFHLFKPEFVIKICIHHHTYSRYKELEVGDKVKSKYLPYIIAKNEMK